MALDLITGSADQPTSTAFVWDPLAQHRFNRDCFVLENVANLGLATWAWSTMPATISRNN